MRHACVLVTVVTLSGTGCGAPVPIRDSGSNRHGGTVAGRTAHVGPLRQMRIRSYQVEDWKEANQC